MIFEYISRKIRSEEASERVEAFHSQMRRIQVVYEGDVKVIGTFLASVALTLAYFVFPLCSNVDGAVFWGEAEVFVQHSEFVVLGTNSVSALTL